MRKLAPMFIMTSLVAFAAGNTLAADNAVTTDKLGAPTVSANTTTTNGKDLSYSDKSNTSPGTNAVTDEDNKDLSKKSDKPAKKKVVKKKVASNARHRDMHKDHMTTTPDLPAANANIDKNPPLSATQAERANSTTGKSAGQ